MTMMSMEAKPFEWDQKAYQNKLASKWDLDDKILKSKLETPH